MFRRARPMEELLRDSGFAYHVGQLMGAAEMASHLLRNNPDEDAQAVGDKLSEVASWFFEPAEAPRVRIPEPREKTT